MSRHRRTLRSRAFKALTRRMKAMVNVNWIGGMAFEAHPPTGVTFVLDSHPEHGGALRGPTPVESLLASVAACSAIDVLAILQKKHQHVDSYRIEVDGERPPQGEFPRPFRSITIRHIVSGQDIDPNAVARAVELSDEKYCSVIATLRAAPTVTSEFRVEARTPA
jgi:putative redox protein